MAIAAMDDSAETEKSSRLYVSGLPSYLDEKRLRETFSEKGEVTDTRIVRTRDGRSRQFGFVGFRGVEEAERAIAYFNNSYIDTSKLSIRFAEKLNSASLARPWSKHSKGSSAFAKRHRGTDGTDDVQQTQPIKKSKAARQADAAEDDPQLREFLEVMQPRRTAATWANDSISRELPPGKRKGRKGVDSDPKPHGRSDEPAAGTLSRKSRRVKDADPLVGPDGKKRKKKRSKDAGSSGKELTVEDDGTDMDYLRSKVRTAAFDSDDDGKAAPAEADDVELASGGMHGAAVPLEARAQSQEGARTDALGPPTLPVAGTGGTADAAADGSAPGRLFLRNLPYGATEADIASLLGEFGGLSEVHLVVDRTTQKSKGYALVQFLEAADAEAALSALDGSIFQGRLLHILPAKAPRGNPSHLLRDSRDGGESGGSGDGYRREKEAKQWENAGLRAAWNPLFMRPDTVAEAIAAHYGVSKSDLLDREAADLPVRMALGEAHVIALTKAELAKAGVSVEAMEAAALAAGRHAAGAPAIERSDRVLLVKNLPFTATAAELEEVFSASGSVTRLVLPKTKTIALVEFARAAEARRAFKATAYRRYQDAPLFLEWAPKDVFHSGTEQLVAVEPPLAEGHGNEDAAAAAAALSTADVERLRAADTGEVESSSLYVKNLAWETSDAALGRHFDAAVSAAGGAIRSARVALRRRGEDKLSAGYGFVECSSEAAAKAALHKLQGSLLDGHKLAIQLSIKKGGGDSEGKERSMKRRSKPAVDSTKQTKLVVRNVAFEATSKELRALFQPFGQVKSVRLPRKFDHSHRGFAFVDFLSHQEASSAMDSVGGTHLYGRRLVCEWAALGDEGLDGLRSKTVAQSRAE